MPFPRTSPFSHPLALAGCELSQEQGIDDDDEHVPALPGQINNDY